MSIRPEPFDVAPVRCPSEETNCRESLTDSAPDATSPSRSDDDALLPAIAINEGGAIPTVECRRCGKSVSGQLARCPFCDARLPSSSSTTDGDLLADTTREKTSWSHVGNGDASTAVSRLLVFYAFYLLTNLLASFVAELVFDSHLTIEQISDRALLFTAFAEGIDTAIVLVAWAVICGLPRIGPSDPRWRAVGALSGPFVLAAVMAMNFGYHALLQNYVQYPEWIENESYAASLGVILTVCIQPGIVEELFFRYLALGTLARVMGVGTAVWVSAVMFGLAHSYVPLSIPILTVVGVGLGYVRVWSGSIVLPMALHAVHNAVVVYLESAS